jgi:hypothetical protein
MSPVTSVNDLIGRRVRVRLLRFPAELQDEVSGVFDINGWIGATITGVDGYGVWLENPTVIDVDPMTKERTIGKGWVLFRWDFIGSIVCMEKQDEEAQFKSSLGFQPPPQKT